MTKRNKAILLTLLPKEKALVEKTAREESFSTTVGFVRTVVMAYCRKQQEKEGDEHEN